MPTHIVRELTKLESGQTTLQRDASTSYTESLEVEVSVAVPNPSTDLEVVFPVDLTAAKTIMFLSDQDLTIETNDGTTPDDTINLVAGIPWLWHADSGIAQPLSADLVSLFLTNAADDATFQAIALIDGTP